MPQTDPIQGFTGLPTYPETYQIPDTLAAMYSFLLNRSVPRFASTTARDAALPSPTDGMVCYVTADKCAYVRVSGAWVRALTEPGAWTDYTPSLVGVTVGNGTLTGRYQVVGKTVNFALRLIGGTTTSFTATCQFGLPVAAADVGRGAFAGWRASPNGVVGARLASTTAFYVYDAATGSAWGSGTTFGSGGDLRISGTYERA